MYEILKFYPLFLIFFSFFLTRNAAAQELPIIINGDEVVLGVGDIRASDLSQDGSLLAINAGDDVFLYNMQTKEFLPFQREFPEQSIMSLSISPNNQYLFTGFFGLEFTKMGILQHLNTSETINVLDISRGSPCEGGIAALKPVFLDEGQRLIVPTNSGCGDLLWEPFKEEGNFRRISNSDNVKAVVSPDERYVAMLAFGGGSYFTIFDGETLQRKQDIPDFTSGNAFLFDANTIQFTPDSSSLVAGEKDGEIQFVDIESSQVEQTLSFAGGVTALGFTPDGQTLLAGNDNGQLAAWDMTNLQRQDLLDLDLPIQQIRATERGVFAVAQNSGKIEIWNVFENQPVFAFPSVPDVSRFVYMPDGKSAIIQRGGQTELWDTEAWIQLRPLPDSFQRIAQTFADGDQAWGVTGTSGRQIDVLDLETGDVINQLDFNSIVEPGDSFEFDLSGNGRRMVTVVRKIGDKIEHEEDDFEIQIRLWDALTGEELVFTTRRANSMEFELSFDGTTLLLRDIGRTFFLDSGNYPQLLNLETNEILHQFVIESPFIIDLLISPNGLYALTGVSGSLESPAKFFLSDTVTGERVHTLFIHDYQLEFPRFSPDSKYLVSRGWRRIRLGHTTFTSSPPEIVLWDLSTGEVIGKFPDEGPPEFSPDGSNLVTRSDVIRIKDLSAFIDQNTSHVPQYIDYK